MNRRRENAKKGFNHHFGQQENGRQENGGADIFLSPIFLPFSFLMAELFTKLG
jgi:hypothetical protein